MPVLLACPRAALQRWRLCVVFFNAELTIVWGPCRRCFPEAAETAPPLTGGREDAASPRVSSRGSHLQLPKCPGRRMASDLSWAVWPNWGTDGIMTFTNSILMRGGEKESYVKCTKAA